MDDTRNQTEWQYSDSNNLWNHGNHYNITPHNSTGNMRLVFDPVMDKAVNILSVAALCITLVSLGCNMEVAKIKAHIVKPKGVAIALVAQFGIMPLAAFSLTKILQVGPIEAVTMLISGCCPGGNLSNIFTLAVEGDVNLSIVMTTCSTVVALGAMPLLLLLYCQGIPNIHNKVPFAAIVISLIMTIVPCLIGIAINHWVPRYTAIVKKVGFSFVLIAVVAVGIMSILTFGDSLWVAMSPKMITSAFLMPLIGFFFGYIMACVFKLNEGCRRTVAIETGCQNNQLCSTILKIAFPVEVIGVMFLYPLLYILFQSLEALLLIIILRCYKRSKPAAEVNSAHLAVQVTVEDVKVP